MIVWGSMNTGRESTEPQNLSTHFAHIYPEGSELLGYHLEHSIVINDINQENETLPEDKINDILQFYKLEGCMEETLTDFEVLVNREASTGGKYRKIGRAFEAENMEYSTKNYMQEKTCSTEMVNELQKRGTHKIHKAK